jgi:hypothetical protein
MKLSITQSTRAALTAISGASPGVMKAMREKNWLRNLASHPRSATTTHPTSQLAQGAQAREARHLQRRSACPAGHRRGPGRVSNLTKYRKPLHYTTQQTRTFKRSPKGLQSRVCACLNSTEMSVITSADFLSEHS